MVLVQNKALCCAVNILRYHVLSPLPSFTSQWASRKNLKPDAIPTIFPKPPNPSCTSANQQSTSGRKRVREDGSSSAGSEPKKARTAYEKRERLRVRYSIILYLYDH